MKRIITYFLLALLILAPVESFARTRLLTSAPVYKGTITGLRVSAVDGTAFIDNLPYTYSSDFSAGVDGWSAVNAAQGTVAAPISIDGTDNALRFTCSTNNADHGMKNGTLTSGKKCKITFNYYIPATNSDLNNIRIFVAGNYFSEYGSYATLDTWTAASVTFTPRSTGVFAFYGYKSTALTYTDAGGDDVFYIKDVTISEITPYMDGNHSIEIYDPSNRMVKGVLKAAGTSEGLSGETITGWGNVDFANFTSSGTNITQMVGTAAGDNCRSNETQTVGALYKTGFTSSQAVASFNFMNGTLTTLVSPAYVILTSLANGANAPVYYTAVGTYTGFKGVCTDTQISSFTHKQVLTPSALGATIVSAKAGETYNWTYKNPNFTYNAASYYVIIKPIR